MISRRAGALALVCTSILTTSPALWVDAAALAAAESAQAKGRPKSVLRVNPALIFPPARIVATAELTGGANDYQDYYCPRIEWVWGDGTQSESSEDCEPYEAGKSEIARRYSSDHNYRSDPMAGAGSYDVIFRMKQGSKVVLSLKQTIKVQGE
jgi:hypothetical protein